MSICLSEECLQSLTEEAKEVVREAENQLNTTLNCETATDGGNWIVIQHNIMQNVNMVVLVTILILSFFGNIIIIAILILLFPGILSVAIVRKPNFDLSIIFRHLFSTLSTSMTMHLHLRDNRLKRRLMVCRSAAPYVHFIVN